MNRRGFIAGLIGLAAPAVITTPGLLMPVRKLIVPDFTDATVTELFLRLEYQTWPFGRTRPIYHSGGVLSATKIPLTEADVRKRVAEYNAAFGTVFWRAEPWVGNAA